MVNKGAPPEEDFNPTGTIVLMIGYIIVFALAWGSVYFFDLLGRR